jgi:hypothetical protein
LSIDLSTLVAGTSALAEAVALELGSAGPLVVPEVPLAPLGGFSDPKEKIFFQPRFFGFGGGCGLACDSLGLLIPPVIDGFILKSDIVDTICQRLIFWEYQVM